MTAPVKLVARKTVTYVQQDSVYKERWTLPFEPPVGTTVRQIFLDSAGAQIQDEHVGVINGRYVEFRDPYDTVSEVPNGALFYTYLNWGGANADGEDMIFYGTVFRRQHVFPNNPAISTSTVVKLFEDTLQRPAGALGGRWKTLVGQPRIFDNAGALPNTIGPNYAFFSRYFAYYYTPFNDDSVELSISALDKGPGKTVISLAQNSSASSYLYLGFDSSDNTVELGIGNSPDIGSLLSPSDALEPQITPVPLTVPSDALATFKLRYDDTTKVLGFYNADMTTLICDWEDAGNVVPHGKGYRYFGVGGNSGLLNSGVQLAYIRAAGIV